MAKTPAKPRYSVNDLIERDRQPVKFEIASQARLATRVAELVLAVIVLAVDRSLQISNLPSTHQSAFNISFALFASIQGLLLAVFGMVVHVFPALIKWKIRSVLITETIIDLFSNAVWLSNIVYFFSYGACPPGTVGCNQWNLVLAFSIFSSISWITSLVFDAQGLYKYCTTRK